MQDINRGGIEIGPWSVPDVESETTALGYVNARDFFQKITLPVLSSGLRKTINGRCFCNGCPNDIHF